MTNRGADLAITKVEQVLNMELVEDRRRLYVEALGRYPDHVLNQAADYLIETWDSPGFPKPASFKKAMRENEMAEQVHAGGMPSQHEVEQRYRRDRIPNRMALNSTLGRNASFIQAAKELLNGARDQLEHVRDLDAEAVQVQEVRISALVRILEQEGMGLSAPVS